MEREQPQKYFNPGFIGPRSLKMHMHIASIVKSAKRLAEYQEGMRCHSKVFLKSRYLIVGAYTLLVPFHHHITMNISWLSLIMYQSGGSRCIV